MPGVIGVRRIQCSPSNVVYVPCSGLTLNEPVTLTFNAQGGLGQTVLTLSATVVANPSVPVPAAGATATVPTFPQAITFTVPDGLLDDTALVTDAQANALGSFGVQVKSQYVQASEYVGDGGDADPLFATLNFGELDAILRRASTAIDACIGGSLRLRQWNETHEVGKGRKLYTFHRPLRTLDSISYINNNNTSVLFQVSDFYVNTDMNYIDALASDFGTFVIANIYQAIGYSAGVLALLVTCGYPDLSTPSEIQEATIMTATEILNRRRRNQSGLGGLKKIEDKLLESDGMMTDVPPMARRMIAPFARRSVR